MGQSQETKREDVHCSAVELATVLLGVEYTSYDNITAARNALKYTVFSMYGAT